LPNDSRPKVKVTLETNEGTKDVYLKKKVITTESHKIRAISII
jgi:hypothetical protein